MLWWCCKGGRAREAEREDEPPGLVTVCDGSRELANRALRPKRCVPPLDVSRAGWLKNAVGEPKLLPKAVCGTPRLLPPPQPLGVDSKVVFSGTAVRGREFGFR